MHNVIRTVFVTDAYTANLTAHMPVEALCGKIMDVAATEKFLNVIASAVIRKNVKSESAQALPLIGLTNI